MKDSKLAKELNTQFSVHINVSDNVVAADAAKVLPCSFHSAECCVFPRFTLKSCTRFMR